jgi:hypothetical protein
MTDDNPKNVVKLSDARKKQRTLKGASTGNGHASGQFGKKPANKSNSFPGGQSKFWTVLQFIIFMVLIAFVMSECGGGH